MGRKLLVAYLALIVCAVFAPTASASPWLTEGGIPIATGTTVVAKSEGTSYRTDATKNTACGAEMHGSVVKNNKTQIEIEISSATGCWGVGAVPWCLRAGTEPAHSFTLDGGKCSAAPEPVTATLSPYGSSCVYSGWGEYGGTYSTNTAGGKLTTVAERFEAVSGMFCPPYEVDPLKFNLTTAVSPFTKLTIS